MKIAPLSVVTPRGPGRPATGVGTPIQVRLQPEDLAALDRWIGAQDGRKPTRPEAIRTLMRSGLTGSGRR